MGMELEEHHKEKGLGLNSIQNRVKTLNGSIKFESERGEGMRIGITIPNLENLVEQETS